MFWLKRLFAQIWNPRSRPLRDKDGIIVPDWRMRKASKKIHKQIATGKAYHAGGGKETVCLKREVQGRVSVKKSGE
jgi:hypothetical protein